MNWVIRKCVLKILDWEIRGGGKSRRGGEEEQGEREEEQGRVGDISDKE